MNFIKRFFQLLLLERIGKKKIGKENFEQKKNYTKDTHVTFRVKP